MFFSAEKISTPKDILREIENPVNYLLFAAVAAPKSLSSTHVKYFTSTLEYQILQNTSTFDSDLRHANVQIGPTDALAPFWASGSRVFNVPCSCSVAPSQRLHRVSSWCFGGEVFQVQLAKFSTADMFFSLKKSEITFWLICLHSIDTPSTKTSLFVRSSPNSILLHFVNILRSFAIRFQRFAFGLIVKEAVGRRTLLQNCSDGTRQQHA